MGVGIPEGPTLLYDGLCRLCRTFARLTSWWGLSHGLRVLPFQREEARRLLPNWTDDRVVRSAHLVHPDGQVVSGLRAFAALLDYLPAIGPIHRRLGERFLFGRLVQTAYQAAIAVRGALRCAPSQAGAVA